MFFQVSTVPSPKHHRPPPISSAPPTMTSHFKTSLAHPINTTASAASVSVALASSSVRSSSPAQPPLASGQNEADTVTCTTSTPLTYSLFNSDKVTFYSPLAIWLIKLCYMLWSITYSCFLVADNVEP